MIVKCGTCNKEIEVPNMSNKHLYYCIDCRKKKESDEDEEIIIENGIIMEY